MCFNMHATLLSCRETREVCFCAQLVTTVIFPFEGGGMLGSLAYYYYNYYYLS